MIAALCIVGYALGAFLTTLVLLANWDAFGLYRDDPSVYIIAAAWPVWVVAGVLLSPVLIPALAARAVARRFDW